MAKVLKKRNWAFLLYPESAPSNWMDIIQQTGLPCVISPLHDKDVNADGTLKKPHYHVVLIYSGPTTYSVVQAFTESLNQPIPQALDSIKGYYRYLTHKDNPEKAQYDESEIKTLNGFNIADYTELTRSEISKIKSNIQKFIRENDITEYAQLMDYLQDDEMNIEYDIASSNTMFFDRYISSRRHTIENAKVDGVKVDPETGEVIE